MSLTLESIAPLSVCKQHLRVLHVDTDFEQWLKDQRSAAYSTVANYLDRPIYSTANLPANDATALEVIDTGGDVITLEQIATAHQNINQIPLTVLRAAILLYLSSANENRAMEYSENKPTNPAFQNLLRPYRLFSDRAIT